MKKAAASYKQADDLLARRLGKAVREIRSRERLSQENLAELSGVHVTYISGLEHGRRNPTLLVLEKVSTGLGVSLTELFARADRARGRCRS